MDGKHLNFHTVVQHSTPSAVDYLYHLITPESRHIASTPGFPKLYLFRGKSHPFRNLQHTDPHHFVGTLPSARATRMAHLTLINQIVVTINLQNFAMLSTHNNFAGENNTHHDRHTAIGQYLKTQSNFKNNNQTNYFMRKLYTLFVIALLMPVFAIAADYCSPALSSYYGSYQGYPYTAGGYASRYLYKINVSDNNGS